MGLFSRAPRVLTEEKKVEELLTRGVESVIPRELGRTKLHAGTPLRVYLGIDPTGARLHLGHSVPLRKLRAFAEMGHEVIFLVGSFTAMIGDPTGRDAMREPLTEAQVRDNFKDYQRQAQKILDFSKVEVRYNSEWLAPLSFGEVVKLASHFTVQQMLKRDMFEKRLASGSPVSLHEFLYPVMVGYDSVVLDVDVELGGSDQEFNMLAGRTLQTALGKRDKFVLTTKLIEGTDGRKMSKTYNNCIYLEDTPSDMYGKIMSMKDELIATYFETCTDVPPEEVLQILRGHPKEAKMRLAQEIVALYHTKAAALHAQEDWEQTFSGGGVPADAHNAPPVRRGDPLSAAIAGLGISNSELRRLLEAGAIREVGGQEQVFHDLKEPLERAMAIRIGKHRFVKVTVQ